MRITELVHDLVLMNCPMDKEAGMQLHNDANKWYQKLKDDNVIFDNDLLRIRQSNKDIVAKGGKPALEPVKPFKLRFVKFAEMWYSRYLFAALFVYLVPKIKEYKNGVVYEDDTDSPREQYEKFLEFQRWNKAKQL